MKPSRSSTLLDTLVSLQYVYDAGAGQDKLRLLQALATARLRTADEVFRLHEILCFMRAYPDNRTILHQVSGMLESLATAADPSGVRPCIAKVSRLLGRRVIRDAA